VNRSQYWLEGLLSLWPKASLHHVLLSKYIPETGRSWFRRDRTVSSHLGWRAKKFEARESILYASVSWEHPGFLQYNSSLQPLCQGALSLVTQKTEVLSGMRPLPLWEVFLKLCTSSGAGALDGWVYFLPRPLNSE
jgi:hypothetical protein